MVSQETNRLSPNNRGNNLDQVSTKSKLSFELSDGSRSVNLGISGNDSNLGDGLYRENRRSASLRPNIPTPSSVYSPYNPGYENFPLYQESNSSDFATPSTMLPLFASSVRDNSVRSSIYSNMSRDSANYYPAPLNLPSNGQINQANVLRSDSRLRTPSFGQSSVLSRSNSGFNNNNPYPLSGNGVLPNVTFNRVSNVTSTIPLDSRSFADNVLPIMPRNHERTIGGYVNYIPNTYGVDDSCSLNYQSRHNRVNTYPEYYNPYISQVNQEIDINKPGIRGRVKLGFKSLGSKFSNGLSKIESAYIKYETISKRHII